MPTVTVTEPTLLLLIVLLILGGGVIGAILLACHRANRHIPEDQRLPWIQLLAVVIVILVLMRPGPTAHIVHPADRVVITPPPATTPAPPDYVIPSCTPTGPRGSTQPLFTIVSSGDFAEPVSSCIRLPLRVQLTAARP